MLGWATLALIGVVFIAHLTWSAAAGRGLADRVAALKAAGEPILPGDFATPPDGPDNGGTTLLAVGDAVYAYQKQTQPATWEPYLPLRPEERAAIEKALADLAPQLAQFEQGRRKPRHDWDLDLASPVLLKMLPATNGFRALANQLGDAALLAHEQGDDAAALRRVDDILFVARFADRHPSLVGHLVSIGCAALACDRLIEITPDLKIGAAAGAAAPQEVRAVIDRLLDDAAARDGLRHALRGERMMQLDAVQSILAGAAIPAGPSGRTTTYGPLTRYVVGPVFHRNGKLMVDRMTALMPLVDEPDLPAVQAKLPPSHQRGKLLNVMADILLPSIERVFVTHHRGGADRRLAATALAIRWYQLEHDGRRAATLEELVPKYLPAVPNDPLLRDRPLGYLPDAPRPRLYSAGENGVDDKGSDAWIRPYDDGRAAGRGDEWRTLDRCLFLDRPPAPDG